MGDTLAKNYRFEHVDSLLHNEISRNERTYMTNRACNRPREISFGRRSRCRNLATSGTLRVFDT